MKLFSGILLSVMAIIFFPITLIVILGLIKEVALEKDNRALEASLEADNLPEIDFGSESHLDHDFSNDLDLDDDDDDVIEFGSESHLDHDFSNDLDDDDDVIEFGSLATNDDSVELANQLLTVLTDKVVDLSPGRDLFSNTHDESDFSAVRFSL